MVPALRKAFNEAFTRQRYEQFLTDLQSPYPGAIEFRVAETPIFVPADFASLLRDACEHIVDLILEPKFREWTEPAIPSQDRVARENDVHVVLRC